MPSKRRVVVGSTTTKSKGGVETEDEYKKVPGVRLASFICVCGAIVLERDKANHARVCSGSARGATTGSSNGNGNGSYVGRADEKKARSYVDDVSAVNIVTMAKASSANRVPLSEMKILKTLNWELAFGRKGQLCIVLQRKSPDGGEPILVVSEVIEDAQLPIHTYRFESEQKHYTFEFFM